MRFFSIPFGSFSRSFSLFRIASTPSFLRLCQFLRGKAVTDFFGKRIAYINVLNRMSVRCDCAGPEAEPPTIGDIGMLASVDLLAIDQASVDLVYDKPGSDNKDLIERIESREGLRQLSYMKELKMGNPNYELISID